MAQRRPGNGQRHAPDPTRWALTARARPASPGSSVTATPAARSCSAPSPSVNRRGSRHAKTTRGMPGRDDVLDAGHRARRAGAAGHERAVDGGVPQPRVAGPRRARMGELTQCHLLGVIVVLLLAGEPGGQHLAVLADDDRPDGKRGARRRAQPGQLDRPAQEPLIRTARPQQVAQQHHLLDPSHVGESHGVIGARDGAGIEIRWRGGEVREAEPRGGGIGDEERGHGQVELVGQAPARKSPSTRAPPSTRRRSTPRSARSFRTRSRESGSPASMSTALSPSRARARADRGRGAVHQAERAGGEEASLRVQVAGGGEGDPGRMLGQAAGGAAGAAARVPDQQPRVVLADRLRADQDGVAARPHLVHAVQVGGAGQDQPPRARVVQVAVRRGGAGQQRRTAAAASEAPALPQRSFGPASGALLVSDARDSQSGDRGSAGHLPGARAP